MLLQTLKFIQEKFLEYYKNFFQKSLAPSFFENREFGVLLLKGKIMIRHKSFKHHDELQEFLCEQIPSDVYYSSAYYEYPAAIEMGEKCWLGADLVFDIDADHIPTPCNKIHDSWACNNCNEVGRGMTPEKCPFCGAQKFDEKSWPCEVCLETAKKETLKLLDMLMKDFGFSAEEVKVGFSGHRGYHVHVENKEIYVLDSMARKEIVDYVTGIGLEPQFHGLGARVGPDLNDVGWRGRISRGAYDFLLKATVKDLVGIGLKKKVAEALIKHKGVFLEGWSKTGPWGIIKGVGNESWKKIAQYGIKLQSAKIDTVVTTDVHRLIRLWDTLHGKTGLKKVEVPISRLEEFDPLKDAVAFKNDVVTVYVSESPKFRVGENVYGPYERQTVELPMAAALMLLCKEVASVVK